SSHDIGAAVGRSNGMIDPALDTAAVRLEILKGAPCIVPVLRQITERVEAIYVAAANEPPHGLSARVVGIPIGELIMRHGEIDGVSYLETDTPASRRRGVRIEKA